MFGTPLPDSPSQTMVSDIRFAQMGYYLHGGTLAGSDVLAVSSASGSKNLHSAMALLTMIFPL